MTQNQDMAQHKDTSGNCNKFYKSLLTLVPLRLAKPRRTSPLTAGCAVGPAVHTHAEHGTGRRRRAGFQGGSSETASVGKTELGRMAPTRAEYHLGQALPATQRPTLG